MLIWFLLLSLLKTFCCLIFFVETVMHFLMILLWKEGSDQLQLFEIEIFCHIINVFTVTFDQLNAFLLNKNVFFSLSFFHLKSLFSQTFEW